MKRTHFLLMILCCLVPLVGLAAILLFNVPVNTVLWIGLILFCPLSHLLMMKFMPHEHGQAQNPNQQNPGGNHHD